MRGPLSIALAILTVALPVAGSRVEAAEKVTIAVGGFGSVAFLPHDVAASLGYFKEQGLEVDSQYLQSGTQASAALLGGSADFAAASLDHAVKAAVQGKAIRMIASFSEVPGTRLVVRSDLRDAVKELRDLRGRPIGVTGLGASTHMILRYALQRAGLRPEEINAVAVGASGMVAALENKRVDGLMAGALPAAAVVGTGRAFVLLDLMVRAPAESFFGGPYQETGMLTRADVIAGRPEVCRAVARAIVKADRWIATHSPEEIAALLPEATVGDRQRYAAAVAAVHTGFSRDGRINPRAVETIVEAHRTLELIPPGARIDPAALYDNTFADQAGAR